MDAPVSHDARRMGDLGAMTARFVTSCLASQEFDAKRAVSRSTKLITMLAVCEVNFWELDA
jgi:hypothetical protein